MPHDAPIFRFNRDNAARIAFRQRQNHAGTFPLHKAVIEIEPDPTRLENILAELGVRCGSFISLFQTDHNDELRIWGNPRQVSDSQAGLRNWIIQSEGPKTPKPLSKTSFAREISTINTKYKDLQKDMERKAQINRFQQNPDPDQHFKYQGAYLWPVEDVKPQEIFGPSLEAFDQIRFALKSHIVFDEKLQIFRIYTDKDGSVAKALKLIEGALKEYHARNSLNGRTTFVHLVDPPERKIDGKNVKLQTWSSSVAPSRVKYQIPVSTSDILDPMARMKWETQSKDITTSNAIKIQKALRVALSNIKHYRGQVHMKMLFGTFALEKFKWPAEKPSAISFERFMENLAQPGTRGTMIRDLQLNKKASQILPKIYSSKDIFEPLDGMTQSLSEVARTYGARFEIIRFEKSAMQLEVEMNSSPFEKELYEKTHSIWTRLDRKDNSIPLNIFMIRLGGVASWKLQFSTESQLERSRMDTKMVNFAASVKLNKVSKAAAELDGRKLFDWETMLPGCLKPSVFEQKIALRYRLRHMPEYVFEFARYDSYDLSTNSQIPITTHWGASMWNNDWDLKLSENAGLGLGESAGWSPRLETFFPDPEPSNEQKSPEEVNPGLKWFLYNVQMIMESLDRIKETPIHLCG